MSTKTTRAITLGQFCGGPAMTVREAARGACESLEITQVNVARLLNDKRLRRVRKVRCLYTRRKVMLLRPSLMGRVEHWLGPTHFVTRMLDSLMGA